MIDDTRPDNTRDALLALIADYLNGAAGVADVQRLEAWLQDSPQARADYLACAFLHAQLGSTPAAVGAELIAADRLRVAAEKTLRLPARGDAAPNRASTGVSTGKAIAMLTGSLLAAACLLLLVMGRPAERRQAVTLADVSLQPPVADATGSYDNRQFPIAMVAFLRGPDPEAPDGGPLGGTSRKSREISPTTLRSAEETALTSASGADVRVEKAAVFGMTAADTGTLYSGSVRARVGDPAATFSVVTSNLRIVDLGTAFRVDRVDEDHVTVTVLEGEVEVQSRVRLPVCYWPFDRVEPTDATPNSQPRASAPRRTTDIVSALPGLLGTAVEPVAGIVGSGALHFDNTRASTVRVTGGTGENVGTGLLSAAEGITVEVLVISKWTGKERDYDEIYRKEDGNCRVLLSFQNDGMSEAAFSEPPVPPGPCLSFGLHLAGRDYRELDMPLDGRDGRPTVAELTDGQPHHVVATYDSFTGKKAIFIDGLLRFEHAYPVGTLSLSGGPADAFIGSHVGTENFHGVIDELALYDFALTADEVAAHHRHAVTGTTYFGSEPPVPHAARWQAVTRITEGQSQTLNQATGLPR